ncbi:MAG: glycosyltransferase family A protein [Ancrocorticia sp.]
MPDLSVAIGVLTFKRNESLEELLPRLLAQLDTLPSDIRAEILVIDNDPGRSAEPLADGRHPAIRYVNEPTPGIAAARQRCLDEAVEFDLLQFIDDDEEPVGEWLLTMINTWRNFGHPSAVAGRVIPRYEVAPSDWIIAGGFFDRPHHPTGTPLNAASSGNLLLDLHQVRTYGVEFDRSLGLSGGEDTLFTTTLIAKGGNIVFCDEAGVIDVVPADRSTREWVLKRKWFHGNTAATTRLRHASGVRQWGVRFVLVAGGAVRVVVGLVRVAAGKLTRNLSLNARGWKLTSRGRGMIAGGLGRVRSEYARKESKSS